MPASEIKSLGRLCLHTITTRPWPLEMAIDKYAAAGVRGITVWREALEGRSAVSMGERIRAAGLSVVSLCRGGFFPAPSQEGRQKAVDNNKRIIDQAAQLGAPLVVLVTGAVPGQAVRLNLAQVEDGIAAVLPHAAACGVRLAIEPLHPMYADSRSSVSKVSTANEVCARLDSPWLGVAVDIFHVWWDPDLEAGILRAAAAGRLFAFHLCDWKPPLEDLLNDRGLMGEGVADIRRIRGWMEESGFDGFNEVEIFSNRWWAEDQDYFLARIIQAYREKS